MIADAHTAPCSNLAASAKSATQLQSCESFVGFDGCVFVFQSAAAAPSPVMGNMPPNDAMPGGPMPPGFFQVFHLSFVICLSPSHPPSQFLTL